MEHNGMELSSDTKVGGYKLVSCNGYGDFSQTVEFHVLPEEATETRVLVGGKYGDKVLCQCDNTCKAAMLCLQNNGGLFARLVDPTKKFKVDCANNRLSKK